MQPYDLGGFLSRLYFFAAGAAAGPGAGAAKEAAFEERRMRRSDSAAAAALTICLVGRLGKENTGAAEAATGAAAALALALTGAAAGAGLRGTAFGTASMPAYAASVLPLVLPLAGRFLGASNAVTAEVAYMPACCASFLGPIGGFLGSSYCGTGACIGVDGTPDIGSATGPRVL